MSKLEDLLSSEILKALLSYDPDTGVFTRIKRTSTRIKCGDIAGAKSDQGYTIIGLLSKRFRAHRLAWLYMTGEWPDEDIDHINGVRSDNRWVNLRSVSRHENLKNASIRSDNSSGVTGVSWDNKNSAWRAKVQVSGKTIHVGRFKLLDDALAAVKAARSDCGFHENHGKPVYV